MTPEEARVRVAAQNVELAGLEEAVARLAVGHFGPVLMAIVRMLIEHVCAAQGDIFRVINKIRFYQGVLCILRENGIHEGPADA